MRWSRTPATRLVGINIFPPPPPVKNYVWRVYSGLNGVRPEPWDAGRQKNGVASGGAGKTERQQNRLRWAKQIK